MNSLATALSSERDSPFMLTCVAQWQIFHLDDQPLVALKSSALSICLRNLTACACRSGPDIGTPSLHFCKEHVYKH
jgi:hypothetical protein